MLHSEFGCKRLCDLLLTLKIETFLLVDCALRRSYFMVRCIENFHISRILAFVHRIVSMVELGVVNSLHTVSRVQRFSVCNWRFFAVPFRAVWSINVYSKAWNLLHWAITFDWRQLSVLRSKIIVSYDYILLSVKCWRWIKIGAFVQ